MSERRVCTECGRGIERPRRDQHQHDGACREKYIRAATRIVGKDLARRIFGADAELPLEPAMEPHRSRRRTVFLKVESGAAIDTGEGK